MAQAKQQSTKPTKKVIAQTVAAAFVGALIPWANAQYGVGIGPEEADAIQVLATSGIFALISAVASFVAGYLKSPSTEDQVQPA